MGTERLCCGGVRMGSVGGQQISNLGRIAGILGSTNYKEGVSVFSVPVNQNYFISVTSRPKNVHMTLVRDAHTGNGLDNERISSETIAKDASEKVIRNRYDKLIKLVR